MKVLLVTPIGGNTGGIAKWARNITRQYEAEYCQDLELNVLPVDRSTDSSLVRSPLSRLYYGVKDYLRLYHRFRKTVSELHPEVVHLNSSASYGLYRDLLFLKYGCRKHVKGVLHLHFGRIPQMREANSKEWRFLKNVIDIAWKVVVMDLKSYSCLKEEGFTNVHYVPNPLDPELFGIIKDIKEERQSRSVFFAGHCLETKGVYEAVKACRNISGLKLTLAGTISEKVRQDLEAIAGQGHEHWLSITGNLDYKEVLRQMLSCSVFILPSYSEGFPNVILEAMACGAPIIATAVGAIPEMLEYNGKKQACGLTVPPRDVEALRVAIESLISDDDRRAQMSALARKKVIEAYSPAKVLDSLRAIWKI